jgi:hypothetical protein
LFLVKYQFRLVFLQKGSVRLSAEEVGEQRTREEVWFRG